ncbi:MAG: bifunctional folylpolyglutamate synthase/dihydrofolate synthase [Eubacteriales bacterium]|nr:bifunctional folylpolyglutamate synthase/dihydrofolate synthase [Eubacteriales bacterium]
MMYNEAIEYIHTRNMYAKKDGLNNITALCQALGNPQDRLKIIHIAGTNGKGSVAAFISTSLKMAGYRVGTCISPFITIFNERIQINGEYISDSDLADYTTRLADINVAVTEFEFITALAFMYFAEKGCDYVVLEAGMGGRFDATNVIKTSVASVLTLIDYDHMQFLGETIEEIANHKCGIIKNGGRVYSYYPQREEVQSAIKNTCEQMDATLTYAKPVEDAEFILGKTTFNYDGDVWELGMDGKYQPYNGALAIEVLKGLGIEKKHIKDGLKTAFMPCRFQVAGTDPYLIFDGAHNISGCMALRESIEKYIDTKPVIIFGMSSDKQYKECIKILAPLASTFVVTGFENIRSTDKDVLRLAAEEYCDSVICTDTIAQAMKLDFSGRDRIVCGSLYLVSEGASQVEMS